MISALRSRSRILAICALGALLCPLLAWAQGGEDQPPWLAVSSPELTVMTDASPERGAEIVVSLELFRRVFARLSPAIELRSPAPTKIIAFRDARSFAPYKSRPDQPGARILGQFLSHPDGNFLTLDAGTRLVGSFAVIYHEYVHYFVRHNFPGVPLWLNEGLAEYYSTFAVEGDGVVLGRPVERHLVWLRRDEKKRHHRFFGDDFSLRDLLTADRHSGAYHNPRQVGAFYALSWALTHYLLSGDPERLDQLADYLVRLHWGEAGEEAFEEAFDLDLERLEEDLRSYALARSSFGQSFAEARHPVSAFVDGPIPIEVTALPTADAAFHLGDLLIRMGRRDAAEERFQNALDLNPEHADAHAGMAVVRDFDGRLDEAEILYRDAIRLAARDPRGADPLIWVRYGRHLLARLQAEQSGELVASGKLAAAGELALTARGGELRDAAAELADHARAAFEHAVALDGDFAEALALFGVSHLLGEVDPGPGIAALGEALECLPDRLDLAFNLMQLHLKKRDFEAAEKVIRGFLEGRAEDEMMLAAREEIERTRLLDAASRALGEGDVERALELFDEAIEVTSSVDLRNRMEERLLALQEQLQEGRR